LIQEKNFKHRSLWLWAIAPCPFPSLTSPSLSHHLTSHHWQNYNKIFNCKNRVFKLIFLCVLNNKEVNL